MVKSRYQKYMSMNLKAISKEARDFLTIRITFTYVKRFHLS